MSWRWLRKRLFKTHFVQSSLSALLALYLWITHWRLKIYDAAHVKPYWTQKKPIIVVFWHNRMALAPFAWQSALPFSMLISLHADGALIARVIGWFGLGSLRVQENARLNALVRQIRKGHSVGITPDGPEGPAEQAKPGVFFAALLAQCDTVVLSYATSCGMQLKSWDRFLIPWPWGRASLVWGRPLPAPRTRHEQASFLEQMEKELKRVSHRAQMLCHRDKTDLST